MRSFSLFTELPNGASKVVRVASGMLLAPFVALLPFSLSAGFLQGVASAFFTSLVILPICLILGAPSYAVLRWKRWLQWYHFAIAGAVSAIIPVLLVLFVFSENLVSTVIAANEVRSFLGETALILLSAGAIGSLVAIVFWLLVHSRLAALTFRSTGLPPAAR